MCKSLSAEYYQKNKERLLKKARERYQNLSKKENPFLQKSLRRKKTKAS